MSNFNGPPHEEAVVNYFIIRCRNLREFVQDLRARDFQWLSDFFSPNICVAKFRSILFLFTTASSYGGPLKLLTSN